MTENLSKLIEYRFQQAQETLAVAEELFGNDHYRDAVSLPRRGESRVLCDVLLWSGFIIAVAV
ncbi:MAG: hypothetical protein ACYSPJ_10485 [Planctomycetota bacterium]|jgi:hypothetical protein